MMLDEKGKEFNCYVAVKVSHPKVDAATKLIIAEIGGTRGVAKCMGCGEPVVIHVESWKAAMDASQAGGRSMVTYCKECHDVIHVDQVATA